MKEIMAKTFRFIVTSMIISPVIYLGIAAVMILTGKPASPETPQGGIAFEELFFDYTGLPELELDREPMDLDQGWRAEGVQALAPSVRRVRVGRAPHRLRLRGRIDLRRLRWVAVRPHRDATGRGGA